MALPELKVTVLPAQILELEATAKTIGSGLTTTVTTPGFVLAQPNALLPETEYVVVTEGHTTGPPLINVYVTPPEGINVAHEPAHTVPGEADTPIVGRGFTVTSTVFVPVQPSDVPETV